ncbi:glycosyltransferase [Alcanivorax sp. 521-1]|uniref:Glycosyltransferase n=1 Tax=Alloalcanivorax profundimaris TaxID=2735259 RepID=A0ABS0ANH2_9GAMM|nr:glycosyltransferase [Alloalcanivorax profundimaris]
MRVLQVLPALNSGGVERGTVEFARELVAQGHESWVLSSGGAQVPRLEAEGSHHASLPVHRKSPLSLRYVPAVRRLIRELAPDVVHVRSRLPAWLVWLAWRKLPAGGRPALVSTFHSHYSVSRYSAVMARPPRVIAISESVRDYILAHYPVAPERITLIPRGVDVARFRPGPPDPDWLRRLYADFPHFRGKRLILMPGRLSRWKGQETFLQVMGRLIERDPDAHGVILGGADANKQHYRTELENTALAMGLAPHVTLVGRRDDILQFYRLAEVVCHLSSKPEPFGRVITESLAAGCKVVAFDRGGARESLATCFPEGLVAPDDVGAVVERIRTLTGRPARIELPARFHLDHQVAATLAVYRQALADRDGGAEARP